jgi:probable HAF family extracellular repeat protein
LFFTFIDKGGELMNIKSKACTSIIFLFSVIANINLVQAVEYTIIDLGTLGGTYSYGESINNYGQVAGSSRLAGDWRVHAYLYDGSWMQDLGVLAVTDDFSWGLGINDSGQVIGRSARVADVAHVGWQDFKAFLYDSGSMHDLNALLSPPCNLGSKGYDINNNGQATGTCSDGIDIITGAEYYGHVFFYDGYIMHDISALGEDSVGYAINSSGHITGSASTTDYDYYAFIYDGNTIIDLGTLGGSNSSGRDINDSGQVTGCSDIANDYATHAFLYSDNTMQDLGALSRCGYGINNNGDVVGIGNGAFLYDSNGMHDLCALTDCFTNGWTRLIAANDINDRGDITGYGEINGETHAFLAMPFQESATPDENDGGGLFAVSNLFYLLTILGLLVVLRYSHSRNKNH